MKRSSTINASVLRGGVFVAIVALVIALGVNLVGARWAFADDGATEQSEEVVAPQDDPEDEELDGAPEEDVVDDEDENADEPAVLTAQADSDADADDQDATATAIYLNGQTGNDTNDGKTAETAVRTFAKAKELATNNQSVTTIYVTGTVTITDAEDLSLDGVVLKRDVSFGGYLIDVNGGAVSLANITIDGNSDGGAQPTKSLVHVTDGGTLNIQDGAVLQNNRLVITSSVYGAEGGAVYASKGTVNMTGGTIQNNRASLGGGILVEWSTLNMSGGTITNNKAINSTSGQAGTYSAMNCAAGGGIAALATSGSNGANGEAVVNLSGGTISDNWSDETGGGISLGYQMVFPNERVTLNMTGGTVDHNSSGSSGGGIYVQAGNTGANAVANISAGYITNNSMTGKQSNGERAVNSYGFGGGGIYVNGYSSQFSAFSNGVLNLTNALITDNYAKLDGGGYAACPVTETHIYVTDGAAIYGNSADGLDSYNTGTLDYGKDILIQADSSSANYGAHAGSPAYTISPIMLGGSAYNWKTDNGAEVLLEKLDGALDGSSHEALALHTDNEPNGKGQALAKVFITGNTSATRGGGIGSNGTVNIGSEDGEATLVVTKEWSLVDEGDIPDSVTVDVIATDSDGDSETIGTVTLTKASNWATTLTNLPKLDSKGKDYEYSVEEELVSDGDFYAYVKTEKTVDAQDSLKATFNITVTNVPTTDVSVTKVWDDASDQDGIRPESVTVTLLANGEPTDQTIELSADDEWTATFDDLAKFDANGKVIEYTVEETEVPEGYVATITGDASKGFTVTNTHDPATTSVAIAKVWDDADDKDGIRPESVTVTVLADGEAVGTVELSADNGWEATVEGLPVNASGKAIEYTVEEAEVPEGYEAAVTGDAGTGFTVTNTHEPAEEPVTPVTPTTPTTPTQTKTVTTTVKVIPDTGDASSLAGVAELALGGGSALAAGLLGLLRSKRRY